MSKLTLNDKRVGYRWTICALLFFATTVNYLDRQVLSLLKGDLEVEFNWTDTDYANIVMVFQLVYAFSLLFAGRIIDWLGTKAGYAWSLVVWSVGAMLHSLVQGTTGFMFARGVLGLGESGNFPAAIKTTAEWFPKKERSLATGIFNSGANVGAIAAPMTVPWLAHRWGWQGAFNIIGAIGFLWLLFWLWLYDSPAKQKRLAKSELDYINSDASEEKDRSAEAPAGNADRRDSGTRLPWYVQWGKLLSYRQTWAFAFGKFMTDGVWWFYLFWLPAFLKAQYGMTGTQIAVPLGVLYTMTCVGSIAGGWFPMYFIKRGYEPYSGRMRAMLAIAFVPLVVLLAQPLGATSAWFPIILIGIGASAHQAWSANIFTTVSDMFPKKEVASVIGIGGMFGGLGGVLINKSGGWLFDAYRESGIARAWAQVNTETMRQYVARVLSLQLHNHRGIGIDLHKVELAGLPGNVANTLKAIDPGSFALLRDAQISIVQSEMRTAYAEMFAVCAVSYLIAWIVMKLLVPEYKKIEDL